MTTSSGKPASGLVPASTLIPGIDALPRAALGERGAVVGALPDRLVEQDHPADVLAEAGGGEEDLAGRRGARSSVDSTPIAASRLAIVGRALVGGQDALAGGDQRPRRS